MTASGGGGWGVEVLSRKEKGLMDMDNSVVITEREGTIRGPIGKGKKYNRD